MSKYLVVEFPNESKAYEGSQALRDLHMDGNISVYAAAVIEKQENGSLVVKDAADEGPIGTAVGMLTGGLVGLLAGPAGVAAGMISGGALGSIADLDNAGVGLDFVDAVGKRMSSGSTAVIAEIEEYWSAPVDTRMTALGGTVHRKWRVDFADQQMEQEIKAWNDELDELNAELDQAAADAKAAIQTRISEVKASVKEAGDKISSRLAQLESQASAKIKELKDQAAKSSAESKAKIEKRIDEI
ncbi:MAG: DUF1269 domain-containing protein, partial [Hyphomicrobiaceae bacterium]